MVEKKQGYSLAPIYFLSILSCLIFFIYVGSDIYFANEIKKYAVVISALLAMALFSIKVGIYKSYAFFCGLIFSINFGIIYFFYPQDSSVIGTAHMIRIPDLFMALGACFLFFPRSDRHVTNKKYSLLVIGAYLLYLWYLLALSAFVTDLTYTMANLAHNGRIVLVFLVFCFVFRRDPDAIKFFILGLSVLAIIQGIVAIFQQLGINVFTQFTDQEFRYQTGNFNRVGGTVGRVNLHSLLGMTLPVILAQAIWIKKGKTKVLLGSAFILGIIALALTRNRGPMLAAIVVILYVFYKLNYFKIIKFNIKLLLMGLLLTACIMGSFFIGGKNVDEIFLRKTYVGRMEQNLSVLERIYNGSPINILCGYGPQQFVLDSYGLHSFEKSKRGPKNIYTIHNQYLLMLYETGVVGFTLYFLWIFLFVWKAMTHPKENGRNIINQVVVTKIGITGVLIYILITSVSKPIIDNISFSLFGVYMAFLATFFKSTTAGK